MSRRRRNPERDASTFVQGDLKNKVARLMHNRHRLIAKFPCDPVAVHRHMFTEKQWMAIEHLCHAEGLLSKRTRFTVAQIPQPEDRRVTATIRLPAEYPCQDRQIVFGDLPSEMQGEIAEWAAIWKSYQQETNELLVKVEEVGKACSTYGQVFRIWPDLQGFFGDYGRAKVDSMVVSSRYPDGVLLIGSGGKALKPEFRPEAFERYTMWIAECLMLPESDGDHVATVS